MLSLGCVTYCCGIHLGDSEIRAHDFKYAKVVCFKFTTLVIITNNAFAMHIVVRSPKIREGGGLHNLTCIAAEKAMNG